MMRWSSFLTLALLIAGSVSPAYAAIDGDAPSPLLWAGGAVIIALLLAILFVLLRRGETSVANVNYVSPAPTPLREGGGYAPNSTPGMRGVVLHGFDSHQRAVRFELNTEELRGDGVVIGRGRDARVQLNDDRVGRAHARLKMAGDRIEIKDLDSKNKTMVNGKPLPRGGSATIQFADRVGFGPIELSLSKL